MGDAVPTRQPTHAKDGGSRGALARWWNGYPAALALALLFAAMAISAARHKSPVYDETAHLAGGASYLLFGDHRLQPENGLLPQLLEGLPGWLAVREGAGAFPSREGDDWAGSDVWRIAHGFLYESGLDWRAVLLSARALVAAVAAALGLLVYAWSRGLHGPAGGLVSLLLYAFSPTLLAHGALATSDLCAAATFLLALAALQAALLRCTAPRVAAAGAALALLFLCKSSALLVIPIAGLMLALRAFDRAPLPVGPISARRTVAGAPCRVLLLLLVPLVLLACVVAGIWAGYGFRFAVQAEGQPAPRTLYWGGWPHIEADGGAGTRAVLWLRDRRLLPEAWLYGLGFVLAHGELRDAFLDGRYSPTGFPGFFPRAALYKTTPAEILLSALAAAAWLRRRRRPAGARIPPRGDARDAEGDGASAAAGERAGVFRAAPLWLLIAAVAAAALGSRLNIGQRHLLPVYPAAFILAGAAGDWLPGRPRWMAGLVLAALGWQAVDSLSIRPDYLAYFSPVCGGPDQGYRHLVDSSLDWGQDLPGLADYLARQRASGSPPEEVYLSYFGTGNPDAEGIVARHLPFVPDRNRRVESYPLGPGLYCLSATMLQNVYTPQHPPWSAQDEARWQAVRAEVERLEAAQTDPAAYDALVARDGEAAWDRRLHDYELLRFERLCAALRGREPDAQIGHSILVYRLDAGEAAAAVYGPPPRG